MIDASTANDETTAAQPALDKAAVDTPAAPVAAVVPATLMETRSTAELLAAAERDYATANEVYLRARSERDHRLTVVDELRGRRDREEGRDSNKEIVEHLKRVNQRNQTAAAAAAARTTAGV